MHKYLILLILISFYSKGQNKVISPEAIREFELIKNAEYELLKVKNQSGLLVLFPCYPCDAENTLTEFNIAQVCLENNFSVLAMNLNKRLWLKIKEKQKLANQIIEIVKKQGLSEKNLFIGGFSSGGNVSLLIADYLMKIENSIKPKGVFIVDSPIDLLALYKTSQKNLEKNFSAVSIQESTWILDTFEAEFGNPENGIENYELNSPYTFESQNIDNLKGLEKLKVRLYTEPDLKWWNENRKNEFEDLNAFYIQHLSEKLQEEFGGDNVELINTINRGFRVNGDRHPHSWSIVDERDLMNWMLD